MKCKNIIPADDWFFVISETSNGVKMIVWRLAAWGISSEDEEVVGLVSVVGGGDNSVMKGTCHLVAIPPLEGTYKHLIELTPDELRYVQNCK